MTGPRRVARRERRRRIRLIDMAWEDLFPIGAIAIPTFAALLLFLKVSVKGWPSWYEMGQSLKHGAWVGIIVLVAMGVVAAVAWMRDR